LPINTEHLRQHLIILRKEPQFRISARNQHPTIEFPTRHECQQPVDGMWMIRAGPFNVALGIARVFGDRMIVRREPHADPAPAEAARDRKTAVGSAKNQRAGTRTRNCVDRRLVGTGTRNFEVALDCRGSKLNPGDRDKLVHQGVLRKFAVPFIDVRIGNRYQSRLMLV
jgi:hypothetical protein